MSIIGKLKKVNGQINRNVSAVQEKCGKSKAFILADMLHCMVRYSASPNNYLKFELYNLPADKRNTYVTYGISRKMIQKFNKQEDIDVFENKLKFANAFADMYCRDFLDVSAMQQADFEAFCQGKEKFICKPVDGAQGEDVHVYHINGDIPALYKTIKESHASGFMLEAWIEQHPVLSEIYPKAVNCLRIITVYDGKETDFLTGGVTFGLTDEIANGSKPSVVAPVDFETGILYKPAANFGTPLYEKHPTTGAQILGVQLPYWQETLDLLRRASARVPTVGYIGWDIALTPNGPVIIEGNTTPGYKYYQIPAHLPDGIGNKEKYIKHLVG